MRLTHLFALCLACVLAWATIADACGRRDRRAARRSGSCGSSTYQSQRTVMRQRSSSGGCGPAGCAPAPMPAPPPATKTGFYLNGKFVPGQP